MHRQQNGRWYVHASFERKDLPPVYAPSGWMGVDLNADSVAHAVAEVANAKPVLRSYAKQTFDAHGPRGARVERLYRVIDSLVQEAKDRKLGIVLEYLDFEHCKRALKTKLGALLHAFPYRKIWTHHQRLLGGGRSAPDGQRPPAIQ